MTKKQIITGQTGSGKTYHTIQKAVKLGKFAYLAPCRQLVYEIYIDYSVQDDCLKTGECKIAGNNNLFAVYESLDLESLENYKSLIIDEAHFLTDNERGGYLSELIDKAEKLKINIFLVTATLNFEMPEFKIIKLKSNFKPVFKRISYEEYKKRKESGVPTIEFTRYANEAMLSSHMLPSDRLKIQLDFRKGKINFVSATNVLAQGINMPAQNIMIDYNPYDSDEVIMQKLGRLGRRGFADEDALFTYCVGCVPEKLKIRKINNFKREKYNFLNMFELENHTVPTILKYKKLEDLKEISPEDIKSFFKNYNNIKYCHKFFTKFLGNIFLRKEFSVIYDSIIEAENMLQIEENKIKKIILENIKR